MHNVIVQKIKDVTQARPLLKETVDLLDRVRGRAYELFQRRGGAPGAEMDDWLQAEREIFQVPRLKLAEEDGEYRLHLAVPGFDAKDIRVAALRDSVIVEGDVIGEDHKTHGNVRVSEFGERKLFRQIPLPEPVDVDRVSATLDRGLLEIRAAKSNHNERKQSAA